MAQSDPSSEYWSENLGRRFWLIASLFYIGALLTHLAFVLVDECGFAFIPGAEQLFVVMILLLLLFEWWSYRRYNTRMDRRTGIGLLVARMVLIEVTSAFDCTATSTILYLFIPFLGYLFINRGTAVGLAILYSLWFALYFRLFRTDSIADYVFRTVVVELAMLFSLAMASVVKEVLAGQAQERKLYGELERAHHQLEAYASQVKELGAIEERNRLARDIHDGIGHYLAAVTVQLEKALAFRTTDPVQSEAAIVDAKRAARDALRDVRRSVRALRSSDEFFSLTAALQELVRRSSTDSLAIDFDVEGDEMGYPSAPLLALYRVAQEGLTNVHRHAEADRARIRLRLGEDAAHLTVDDNGKGFDVTATETSSREHQGLVGMRERLALVGGELILESSVQTGTRLSAVVPRRPRGLPGG